MKNRIWIVIVIIFAAIMLSAAVLYPKLAERYDAVDTPAEESSDDVSEDVSDETFDSASEEEINSEIVQADDFTVYESDGNEVTLSEYFGRPIVINFWASWCTPCKSELPAFDTLYGKYRDEVEFFMINLTDGQRETMDDAMEFLSENGYQFPVYYDIQYDAVNTYGIYSIPETVFIRADGSVYDIRIGTMSEDTLEGCITGLTGDSQ